MLLYWLYKVILHSRVPLIVAQIGLVKKHICSDPALKHNHLKILSMTNKCRSSRNNKSTYVEANFRNLFGMSILISCLILACLLLYNCCHATK